MRRTSALSLIAFGGAGLVSGRVLRPTIESFDTSAPRVGWSAALALFLVAAVLGGFAWNTWQSLHKRKERMTSAYAIKMLSLAKASAIVGALVAGVYFGYALAFIDALETPLGEERVVHSSVAGLAAVFVMVAGLLLERALRVPEDSDDEGGKKGNGSSQAGASPA